MSSYTTITLSENAFREVIDAIECAIMHQDSVYDIQELVHLIDLLDNEYDEDSARKQKDWEMQRKYEAMHEDGQKPYPILFNEICQVLREYGVKTDIPNQEFYLACELSDKMHYIYEKYYHIVNKTTEEGD